MMKEFDYVNPYSNEEMKAVFVRDSYVEGDGLYLGMQVKRLEEDYYEPWCSVTVNIVPASGYCSENCAYLDDNNCPDLEEYFAENGLAEKTGRYAVSGFRMYPEYDFSKLIEMIK